MDQSRVARARQLLTAGDAGGAQRECEAILAAPGDEREAAAAHLVLAACCQLRKDLAAAATHVQSALALTRADPIVHYALAEILDARGDKAGAIASVRRAIEINPGVARVHNLLGILLGESGDDDGAIAAFEQTVRIDPKHARAWNNLGNAQRTLGRLAEAEESFAARSRCSPTTHSPPPIWRSRSAIAARSLRRSHAARDARALRGPATAAAGAGAARRTAARARRTRRIRGALPARD